MGHMVDVRPVRFDGAYTVAEMTERRLVVLQP
jgi:hypothetical protein